MQIFDIAFLAPVGILYFPHKMSKRPRKPIFKLALSYILGTFSVYEGELSSPHQLTEFSYSCPTPKQFLAP